VKRGGRRPAARKAGRKPAPESSSRLDALRRAAEARPGDAEAARRLSDALEERGEIREAAAVLERAAEGVPDPDVIVDLAYARLGAGDVAGARRAFERAMALRPTDGLIRQPLAQIYESMGKQELAAQTLAAIPRALASPRVLGDLVRLCLGLGRWREAEAACVALRANDPEHALLAQHGMTLCRIKLGDWRGALDVALGATRLDRYDLTTAFLAYAKDRLFHKPPDALQREADLAERFLAALREHEDAHAEDEGFAPAGGETEGTVGG
jgi:Flp pilus assembly protein TadD